MRIIICYADREVIHHNVLSLPSTAPLASRDKFLLAAEHDVEIGDGTLGSVYGDIMDERNRQARGIVAVLVDDGRS